MTDQIQAFGLYIVIPICVSIVICMAIQYLMNRKN